MLTTDKLRKSISTTDSTGSIQEAKYLCGESMSKKNLLKSIVRLSLCDLCSTSESLRMDAMRYILSREFEDDSKSLSLPHKNILKTINDTISLKQNQKRAIINKLITKIKV